MSKNAMHTFKAVLRRAASACGRGLSYLWIFKFWCAKAIARLTLTLLLPTPPLPDVTVIILDMYVIPLFYDNCVIFIIYKRHFESCKMMYCFFKKT